MKSRFIVPLLVCVLFTLTSAGSVWGGSDESLREFEKAAGPYAELQKMNADAAALYAEAHANNRQSAYMLLLKVKNQAADIMLRSFGSKSGWDKLDLELSAAEESLSAGKQSHEWMENAARIALAADALASGSGGLWLQYEKLLEDDMVVLRRAWKRGSGEPSAAAAILNGVSAHAGRVEAAASMAGSPEHAERLISEISRLEARLNALASGASDTSRLTLAVEASFLSMEEEIARMFAGAAYDSAFKPVTAAERPGLLQWALFLGTVISAVLTWAGWRKYKQNPFGVKPLS